MRTIIYGDIHGCLEELKELRSELKITKYDREISVGDILDRGESSNAALRYIREQNIELVMGNHEYKYVRYYKHEIECQLTGRENPIKFDDEKLSIYENISTSDMEFLQNAPFFVKIDNLTIVHAGITNRIILEDATKKELESLTRIRKLNSDEKILALGQEEFGSAHWSDFYNGNQGIVVYGHEVFDKVKVNRYSFGIDTGCVYGKKLTALTIYDTKNPMLNYDIISMNALKEYSIKENPSLSYKSSSIL